MANDRGGHLSRRLGHAETLATGNCAKSAGDDFCASAPFDPVAGREPDLPPPGLNQMPQQVRSRGGELGAAFTQSDRRRTAQSSASGRVTIADRGRKRRAAVAGTMPGPTPAPAIRQTSAKPRSRTRGRRLSPSLAACASR